MTQQQISGRKWIDGPNKKYSIQTIIKKKQTYFTPEMIKSIFDCLGSDMARDVPTYLR